MFVIMSENQKYIVKGKSRKFLCGIEEETKKELVTYRTEQDAKAAIMRMMPIPSDFVKSTCEQDTGLRLIAVQLCESGSKPNRTPQGALGEGAESPCR